MYFCVIGISKLNGTLRRRLRSTWRRRSGGAPPLRSPSRQTSATVGSTFSNTWRAFLRYVHSWVTQWVLASNWLVSLCVSSVDQPVFTIECFLEFLDLDQTFSINLLGNENLNWIVQNSPHMSLIFNVTHILHLRKKNFILIH